MLYLLNYERVDFIMNIKIGEIIKKLRKDRDVTQEKLADYLGISYQAVSKWENGTALPDITLVVPLANFFGVSADELFSLNEQITDAKIKEYEEKLKHFNNIGDTQASIELMREALTEYPRKFSFMTSLASALFGYICHKGDNDESIKEIISLCERVLEDCTEDSTRQHAIQLLCFTYPRVGQREKAIELAGKMPTMCLCSSMLLEHIYENGSDEKIRTIQRNIQEHIDWTDMNLNTLARQKDITLDERILCIETAIKLFEAIYYDGNLGFYHCRLAWDYYALANHYKEKDKDITLKHLLTAEKHAVAVDEFAGEVPYTSLFVNKQIHSSSGTSKNWIGTECGNLLERIDDGFASLHDNPEFIALKERLVERQKDM